MNIDDLKIIKEKNTKEELGFPALVKELLKVGIISYEVNYETNETTYYNKTGTILIDKNQLPKFVINKEWHEKILKLAILDNQHKKTTYLEFSKSATDAGVKTYTVDFINKICIYYNYNKTKKLEEQIPFL